MSSAAGKRKSSGSGESQGPPKPPRRGSGGSSGAAASPLDEKCINTIRCLGADMPAIANSGHPGAPMGCAPIAHALWGHVMNYNAANPKWWNRDRFVLSNGHACALQYAMLHLSGYNLSIDDLKAFRSANSKTPGHPECYMTEGIEVCTGPLGQGLTNAVGLAWASHHMAARYGGDDGGKYADLFDNRVYCICGDGCLMEGVASEACSLAGHLGLGRLIVIYDDNKISIDGSTTLAFGEDVVMRFKSYNWQVLTVENGDTDFNSIKNVLLEAREKTSKPTLIKVRTTIGYGSTNAGTEKVHGSALKPDDMEQLREKFGFDKTKPFHVDDEVKKFYSDRKAEGEEKEKQWNALFADFSSSHPKEAAELKRRFEGKEPEGWRSNLPTFTPESKADSTRSLSGQVLNVIHKAFPELVGGSADLEGSNKVGLKGEENFTFENPKGRYIRFGVREHAMAGMCNGIYAYGGMRPFGATFLNFITYAWGSVRLAALSKFGVLMVATHDSIELGEDGPTHQPVEVLPLLRATPRMVDYRPCDGNEVVGAYLHWIQEWSKVTVIALSRDAIPHLKGTSAEKTQTKGGYILEDFANPSSNATKKVVLAGSGTEVHMLFAAAEILRDQQIDVRIVSLPSWRVFADQSEEYRRSVIPDRSENLARVYVEAASSFGWEKYFDCWVGMETFGMSAPKEKNWLIYGFFKEHIANRALQWFNMKQVEEPQRPPQIVH